MEDRDAQRAEALDNIRLALAAIELQLDALKARLKCRHVEACTGPASPPDLGFANQVIEAMKNLPADQANARGGCRTGSR